MRLLSGIIALVSGGAAVLTMLMSQNLQMWVDEHGSTIYWIAVALLTACIALLDKVIRLWPLGRAPDPWDAEYYDRILSVLGPDSPTIIWLKSNYIPQSHPKVNVVTLARLTEGWERETRAFRNQRVRRAFDTLRERVSAWSKLSAEYTFTDSTGDRYHIPPEWESSEPEKYAQVTEALGVARDRILESHARFLAAGTNARL